MAKSDAIEQTLSKLAALRTAGRCAEVVSELAKALVHKNNLVVAKAATVAHEIGAADLAESIEKQFNRFMANPTTTDKGCAAKTAIATALYNLNHDARDVFLAGIRHRQPEASWGKPVDTAAELRGTCALGLVRGGYPHVMAELGDLLADGEPVARIAAARAIAYSGREDSGTPLLRMKALLGDADVQVTGECLSALMRLSPAKSIAFLGRFLDQPDESVREAALVALGESRHDGAFDLLKSKWETSFQITERRPLLTAIALLRTTRAIEFLLETVRAGHPGTAVGAIEAMRIYRHDSALRDRIRVAVESTDDERIKTTFARNFPAT